MKKNRILAILLTFVMLASMLSACSKNDSNKNGTNTTSNQQSASEQKNENNTTSNTASSSEKTGVIKIGSIHDLSGNGSVLGNASVQGHKLAIEDINNAGGVKIGDTTYTLELVSYDCKSDPNEGISALKRLAEVDNVALVLGPSLSNVGLATAPYTEEYGISFLGQFGDPRCMLGENLDSLNRYMFLMQPSSHQSAIISGAYMIEKFGYTKVGMLIAQDHSYCASQANAFMNYCKEMGIEIVAEEYNKQSDMDMKTQLTTIKNKGAEFIFNANPTQPLVVSTSQKYQLGIDIPQTGSLDFSAPFATLVSDPAMASNIYFVSNVDYDDPDYLELSKKCKEAFGEEATVKTALGYDQVLLAVAAIKEAGSLDREAIRNAIENLKNVDTLITDNFTMDPETHIPLGLEMCIYKIENGEYKMVEWYVPDYLK
jgi:branched-chain amino acid transport system substrate-binding protein